MRDPYRTLDVMPGATDEQIHRAYLAKVQEFPPDRDAMRFQEIRQAYEAVKTRRLRLQHELFNREPPEVADLLEVALAPATLRRPKETLIRQLLSPAGAPGQRKKQA